MKSECDSEFIFIAIHRIAQNVIMYSLVDEVAKNVKCIQMSALIISNKDEYPL